ncbi:MAG: hypothetical protein ACM3ON_04650 [Chloroflexota bacterium]
MERSLSADLTQRTRSVLDSLRNLARFSRGKFLEKEFGDFFFKAVMADIEKVDILLSAFLNYTRFSAPVVKTGTVNTLVEEVIRKHLVKLDERKIQISRKLESDLPEAVARDEQMIFILDTVLQYALALAPPGSSMEFTTRTLPAATGVLEQRQWRDEGGRNIEVALTFSTSRAAEQPPRDYSLLSGKDDILDLLLRVVDSIAEMSLGKMEFARDETANTKTVSVKFPAERRRLVYYEPLGG